MVVPATTRHPPAGESAERVENGDEKIAATEDWVENSPEVVLSVGGTGHHTIQQDALTREASRDWNHELDRDGYQL